RAAPRLRSRSPSVVRPVDRLPPAPAIASTRRQRPRPGPKRQAGCTANAWTTLCCLELALVRLLDVRPLKLMLSCTRHQRGTAAADEPVFSACAGATTGWRVFAM